MDSLIGTEYLPNAHIEKITLQSFSLGYRALVTVSMYDYLEQTWSKDEKFTAFLEVKVGSAILSQEITSLLAGELSLDNLTRPVSTRSFQAFSKSIVSIRGTTYTKFTNTVTIAYNNSVKNLCVACASMIDLENLKSAESLDLTYAEQNYIGSVKVERVLSDGLVVEVPSYVFLDNEENVWSGPIHIHESSAGLSGPVFMAGSQHVATFHPTLNRIAINNEKIESFLQAEESEEGNLSTDPQQPRDSNTNPQVSDELIQSNTAFLFQEDYVEDHLRNVSNVSILDLENLVVNESIAASLMAKYNNALFKELMENTNLRNISINRFPVQRPRANIYNRLGVLINNQNFADPTLIARSNNNSRKVKEKTLYKISSRKLISVDPTELQQDRISQVFDGKKITKSLLKQGQAIGKVEQLNLSLPKNLRAISFVDYDIKNSRSGKYKHQIKVTLQDEPYLFCKKILKDSFRFSRKIQNLYNSIIMKNVYSGDQFKISFLQEFYSQYNIGVNDSGNLINTFDSELFRNSYLNKAFENLLQIEKLVGLKKPQANQMKSSVNMFTTSPEKILNTITYYNKIIDKFKTLYRLSDGQGYEKAASKKRKDRGVIEKVINLRKTYERKKMMPIGINFIGSSRFEGVSRINLNMFKDRSVKEKKKFFSNVINKDSPEVQSLPVEIRSVFSDIETNAYKDFSPSKIFFGDKEVDTTEINPESFDTEFFNNLRVANAALKSNEVAEEREEIGETEEEVDAYIDSRGFLGDTSKFNSVLLKVLSKNPFKIKKLRKKFKLMDNKILKNHKKQISLKTFDVTQPNNAISSLIKKQPEKIPLQIKALSLLKTSMTKFDMDTIEFDPISNPQTQEVFSQNYLNLGKVTMLEGFERINGRLAMNKPIYKEIEPKMLANLEEKNFLCKIVPQALEGLTTDSSLYNIHDKVFMLESTTNDQMNVQQLSGTSQEVTMPEAAESGNPGSTEDVVTTIHNDFAPAESSSTAPLQNLNNFSVVSIFPLVTDQLTPPESAAADITLEIDSSPPTVTSGVSY